MVKFGMKIIVAAVICCISVGITKGTVDAIALILALVLLLSWVQKHICIDTAIVRYTMIAIVLLKLIGVKAIIAAVVAIIEIIVIPAIFFYGCYCLYKKVMAK